MRLLSGLYRRYLKVLPRGTGKSIGPIIGLNVLVTGAMMLRFEQGAADQKILDAFD